MKGIEYRDSEQKVHKFDNFDHLLVCGGVGCINIGKMLGIRVPMYGIKGHSLNYYTTSEDMIKNTYTFYPEKVRSSIIYHLHRSL